jgi:hypothetical protein
VTIPFRRTRVIRGEKLVLIDVHTGTPTLQGARARNDVNSSDLHILRTELEQVHVFIVAHQAIL